MKLTLSKKQAEFIRNILTIEYSFDVEANKVVKKIDKELNKE